MIKDSTNSPASHKDSARNDALILKELGNSGGKQRPFSLPDLIELGTLDLGVAAWLVSHVSRGASFIVGAGPSGAGKTTIMRALLSFVPGDLPFALALPGKVPDTNGAPRCIISHELSDHQPSSIYLWGKDLREFFALSEQGHMLVGNMHADELAEVHAQVSGSNGVPESQFRAVNLFVFVGIEGAASSPEYVRDSSARRVIRRIFFSDGAAAHRAIFTCDKGLSPRAPRHASCEARCRKFLEETLGRPSPTIEETRRTFLAWEKRHSRS